MRGTGRHSRRTRLQAIAIGLAALAAAALLGACGGGGDSSSFEEASGTFDVKVTDASFPTLQRLGQTSILQLGVRNTGDRTVPNLTVSFTIKGQEGEDSSLPFGVSDPQTELAQPDRPVWVLSATYPRLLDSSDPGGASTSSPKTFAFGPLKPGETTSAVWKLNAVRAGKYTLLYDVGAGIGGEAKAQTEGGVTPGGSFTTEISDRLPETEVTDSGEIVEIQKGK
ncbi:MAG TPA: hypothetical protein VFN18_00135 [Solirubrobacterales bacterium]|nr:hypothetical protein [Solirubrobacterales bacterium]